MAQSDQTTQPTSGALELTALSASVSLTEAVERKSLKRRWFRGHCTAAKQFFSHCSQLTRGNYSPCQTFYQVESRSPGNSLIES